MRLPIVTFIQPQSTVVCMPVRKESYYCVATLSSVASVILQMCTIISLVARCLHIWSINWPTISAFT